MFDVQKLLGQMISGGGRDRHSRRSSGGFGIPGVSNAQLGVGAIGLAIAAWEHFKSKPAEPAAPAAPAPLMTPPPPPPPPAARASAPPAAPALPMAAPSATPAPVAADDRIADAAHLIRSMIAAANADGTIDSEERANILQRAMEAGLDSATQQFLMGELRAPASAEQIAAATRAELRLETWAAALIAITVDNDAENAYLERLATALGLSVEDQQRVREQLGMA